MPRLSLANCYLPSCQSVQQHCHAVTSTCNRVETFFFQSVQLSTFAALLDKTFQTQIKLS